MQETQVQSLGWEDPLEEEMATHYSIPCLENPKDKGAWRATVHGIAGVGHDLATKPPYYHTDTHTHTEHTDTHSLSSSLTQR